MDTVQPYAQAYFVHDSKIFLLRIQRTDQEQGHLWVPLGGHLVKEHRNRNPHLRTRSVYDPFELLLSRAKKWSEHAEFFSYVGHPLVDTYVDVSSSRQSTHFTLVYYGMFRQAPPLEENVSQLFSKEDLLRLQEEKTLDQKVQEYSLKAIRLYEIIGVQN